MENFIEIYNPRNASKLTEEQIQAMQTLTDEQIKALAEAYPNQPTGNAYLQYLITSEPLDKQRFPLGTWKNLHSLRKLGKKEIVPFGFVARGSSQNRTAVVVKKPAVKKTVDLSKNEVIEGLKTTEPVVDVNEAAKQDFIENPETVVTTEPTEAVNAYNDAVKNLEDAKAANAHPQTLKSLERKIAAAKELVDADNKG